MWISVGGCGTRHFDSDRVIIVTEYDGTGVKPDGWPYGMAACLEIESRGVYPSTLWIPPQQWPALRKSLGLEGVSSA